VNALPGLLDNEDDFTEARRRGLARFLEFIGRHPVLAEDEDVRYFYTEVDEARPPPRNVCRVPRCSVRRR